MGEAKNKIVWTGDTADAVRAAVDLTGKVEDLEKKLGKMAATGTAGTKETKEGFDLLNFGIAQFAGIVGGLSLMRGLDKVQEAVTWWAEKQRQIADDAKRGAEALAGLALKLPTGQVAGGVEREVARAAGYGIKDFAAAGETARFFRARFAAPLAERATETAYQLSQLGVPLAPARGAISAGMGAGLEPELSGRLAFAVEDPELLAGVGGAARGYRELGGGLATGYGVAKALAEAGAQPSEMPRYLRGIKNLMQAPKGRLRGAFAQAGIKAPGADVEASLQALAAAGVTSEADVRRLGIGAREAEGLGILVSDVPRAVAAIRGVRQRLAETPSLEARAGRLMRDFPQLAKAERISDVQAQIAAGEAFGPEAEPAMEQTMLRLARYRAVQMMAPRIALGYDKEKGLSGPEWNYFLAQLGGTSTRELAVPTGFQAEALKLLKSLTSAAVSFGRSGTWLEEASGNAAARRQSSLQTAPGGGG